LQLRDLRGMRGRQPFQFVAAQQDRPASLMPPLVGLEEGFLFV
jgi:hypothetical protein